ncbi:MAG: glutamate synthase subunit alpha [Nitrospirae bacterium GWC2_57_13]|jgi:glutamate synthase (NADPH) large chain|nr:MAG: glutamate synthase subunit alpha [Nitrospirae bacterium GWC2_57_13]
MERAIHASCGVGFVCHTRGAKSHAIVAQGLEAVRNLTHRGAVGADGKTGDGCGITVQLPHRFLLKAARKADIPLINADDLALGVFFLHAQQEKEIEDIITSRGLTPLGWRDVPVGPDAAGKSALATLPRIRHLYLDASAIAPEQREIALFLGRREIEKRFSPAVYIPSLSSRTIVYKGMLLATHLQDFYPDLVDPDFESAFCLFHQRFSTNTLPDWTLAQPFRVLAHNGEINTLQGNRNWMALLEQVVRHEAFGNEMDLVLPLTSHDESDSASLDRVVEFLMLGGYSPAHALTLCIPPAWETLDLADEERAFFEYHSFLMKPWDGPAAVAFTDGSTIGAHMDRNGLRPLRYTLTGDGLLVLGSETGMIDLNNREIREKGRLGPGETIAVDLLSGTVKFTTQIVKELTSQRPYNEWVRNHHLHVLPERAAAPTEDAELVRKQIAFSYTVEEIESSIEAMAVTGHEPVYSMGDDTPLPPLAVRPPLLFRYFRQKFSQVTNPPIDPIREKLVMSLRMNMGPKRNILEQTADHARRLGLESPVLTEGHLRAIEKQKTIPVKRISTTFSPDADMARAVEDLRRIVITAAREGAEIVVLSDRDVARDRMAIPSLLALSASYKALRAEQLSFRTSVIVETGEARDTHHFACLLGYGASAVLPWLAFRSIADLCSRQEIPFPYETAEQHYVRAVEGGLYKVIARLGISTLNSYHGAQLFDALCLDRDFLNEYFSGTALTIEADGMQEVEASSRKRHSAAYDVAEPSLERGGDLRYRKDGERHAWAPAMVASMNRFLKSRAHEDFRQFSRIADSGPVFLRNLLAPRIAVPLLLNEVEPEEAILSRFVSGAMSVGALSPEAHEAIAEACNKLGIKSNSGEGGEDPARYFTNRNSAMKQIASGRFGVTPTYLASAADLEIKIAQGAKPGEGGHLPAEKVTDYIASLRHCPPGRMLISPPPHHDIYSIEDLAQLIHDLKQANPRAHVCVKLVSESGVGTVAAGCAKAYADIIQVSGCEGGTGAATISSIKNAGNYWETGLAEMQRVLMENGLREKVRLRVDGGLRTGKDVVIAAMLGAEEFGFGTATMIAAGCVMARVCHSNTCPTGIATQDETLRKRFRGSPENIMAYFRAVAQEVREALANMGVRSLSDIIGRNDLLVFSPPSGNSGASRIDVTPLLQPYPEGAPRACGCGRNDNFAPTLNDRIVQDIRPFIEQATPVEREYSIRNIDRSIPAKLNYYIAKKYRDAGLPPNTITLRFRGTAGQSFGAFNHRGLSLFLTGDANDYAGKGMFGGMISIIHSDIGEPHKHVIVGNTVLYGAIGGEFYAAGMAGERFAVRNSGAEAVVEGAGHHLCEYMTRGTVVVLGEAGYNIGAGMTGGVIYLLDRNRSLERKINASYVEIRDLDENDLAAVRTLIESHHRHTGSLLGREILSSFDRTMPLFRKIIPR